MPNRMGLREKVALLVVALSFVQITYVECGSNANNLKSPMKMISKPKRTKWPQSKSPAKPTMVDESLKRRFNFPDVDYPLPPTFVSTSYYNPKLDFTKSQVVTQPRDSIKNIAQQSINKKNRKYNGSFKSPKKSFYVTYPDDKGTQMPSCLNGKELFPSVDYPTDASQLWKTHYWERINTKPVTIQNLSELGTNSKAKMKISASKASTKAKLKRNLSNSTVDDNLTINHKENCEETLLSSKEGSIYNPITNYGNKCSDISESSLVRERLNATKECESDKFYMEGDRIERNERYNVKSNVLTFPSSDVSSCNGEDINEELYPLGQVTPSPIDRTSSFYHEYITPMPKTLSPLTTVAPFSMDTNNIDPGKVYMHAKNSDFPESDSREVEPETIGLEMTADEMACTVIYPEVFNSLTTSTMAPIYSDMDGSWMDPELDNHTLNTYSDEVEQYYIWA